MLGKIWTRSINRSLPCLLSIIFDCWGENFAREKPNPPSTPCLYLFIFIFLKENRLSGTAGSALFITAATSLPPVSLCSPSIPTLIEKPWKEFPGQKKKRKNKSWISLISDLSRPLYNIHLFRAAFDTSFPPTPIRNQPWVVASLCSFFSSLKVRITILFLSRAREHQTREGVWVSSTPGEMHTFCLWQRDESHELEPDTNLSALGKRSC